MELNEKIAKLKKAQQTYKDLIEEQYNKEQALKLTLNSIYGAFGNKYFTFFNTDIAEAITMQAKEINLYAEKVLNHYFANLWLKDKDLHERLGIEITNPISKNGVVYMDTDSCYVTFKNIFDSTNYKETKYKDNELQLILDIAEFRLKDYLVKAFDKFAELRNTPNYQKFEMESIAKKAIWLGKKKYFQDVIWEDPGTFSKSLTNIKSKGIEVIQSSTPTIIRKELKDILEFFLNDNKIEMLELITWLKEIKEKFINDDNLENKCKNIRVNNYEEYCIDDKDTFQYAFKCPINVRAAIYHNHKINSNKLNGKYELISSGNKVKFYYCKSEENEVFAFKPGSFPKEVAPPIDYDTMFYKVVITPINSILESIGMPKIDEKLQYKRPLF